jgi:hypothetical protein
MFESVASLFGQGLTNRVRVRVGGVVISDLQIFPVNGQFLEHNICFLISSRSRKLSLSS